MKIYRRNNLLLVHTHLDFFSLKYRDILSFDENPVFVHLSTKKIIRPNKGFDEMTHSTIKWVAKKFRRKNFRPNVATPPASVFQFSIAVCWTTRCSDIMKLIFRFSWFPDAGCFRIQFFIDNRHQDIRESGHQVRVSTFKNVGSHQGTGNF